MADVPSHPRSDVRHLARYKGQSVGCLIRKVRLDVFAIVGNSAIRKLQPVNVRDVRCDDGIVEWPPDTLSRRGRRHYAEKRESEDGSLADRHGFGYLMLTPKV